MNRRLRAPVSQCRPPSVAFRAFAFITAVVLCRWWAPSPAVVSAASAESTPLYLRSAYPLWEPQLETGNAGERLRLTAYLERGKVDEARKVARVGPGLFSDRAPSYSGFLTIDHRYNSNLFFWFFPSQVGYRLKVT